MLTWGNLGQAPGQLDLPCGVATDAQGNVYVLEREGHRVQKFDFLGNFILEWGTFGAGPGQFDSPTSIATDGSGNVYVTDSGNHRVEKFSHKGDFLGAWTSPSWSSTGSGNPYGIATDRAGNVYVSEWNENRIQKFSSSGTPITQWGSTGNGDGQFDHPMGIAVDVSGFVFVTDQNGHVQKFTNTGAFVLRWGSTGSDPGQFRDPTGIAVDPVGRVYVSDDSLGRVQVFSKDGNYLTQWGTTGAGKGQFLGPVAIAVDAGGNAYVADSRNSRLQKFSGSGNALIQAPPAFLLQWGGTGGGDGQFGFARAVDVDPWSGDVYVADVAFHWNRIQKFKADGTYLTQWGSKGTGDGQFWDITGLGVSVAGYVFVADAGNHRIQVFSPYGSFARKWGPEPGPGQLEYVRDVAVAGWASDVYAIDNLSGVVKFESSGSYLTEWGAGDSWAVAADAFGHVYIGGIGTLRCFSGDGTLLKSFSESIGAYSVAGLATDAAGNVYMADRLGQRVVKFTGWGTYLTEWDVPPGYNLADVALDAAGNVYVTRNTEVKKYAAPPLIALVSDVSNDQGHQVRLRILRCSADFRGSGGTVTGYAIYRRVDPPIANLKASENVAGASQGMSRPDLAGWDYVGTQPAAGDAEYSMVVPTLVNGNASSVNYSAFMVRALTSDPLVHFDSAPEYGYSVDNLSPPAPTNFAGAQVDNANRLHWDRSSASDFATFKLYRGPDPDFVPNASHLILTTTDTGCLDPTDATCTYKISAVDVNGNEGVFAALTMGTTSGPGTSPLAFALYPVYPNPSCDHRLSVRFVLPVPGAARIHLINVAGRTVIAREVGHLGPGEHTMDLVEGMRIPSGIYFVHFRQGQNEKTVRAIVLE